MQKHGGTIEVESEPGVGTTFLLTFVRNSPATGLHLMVVDDEEGARVLHSRYIKRFFPEATISHAADGRDAIEAAIANRPHAIITDYGMQVMDGFELLTELKRYAETKNIPVVVITGEDSKASIEAMMLAGASAVFTKPVIPEKLEAQLRSVLKPFLMHSHIAE
jgi:CheY-like chemotaxis protein